MLVLGLGGSCPAKLRAHDTCEWPSSRLYRPASEPPLTSPLYPLPDPVPRCGARSHSRGRAPRPRHRSRRVSKTKSKRAIANSQYSVHSLCLSHETHAQQAARPARVCTTQTHLRQVARSRTKAPAPGDPAPGDLATWRPGRCWRRLCGQWRPDDRAVVATCHSPQAPSGRTLYSNLTVLRTYAAAFSALWRPAGDLLAAYWRPPFLATWRLATTAHWRLATYLLLATFTGHLATWRTTNQPGRRGGAGTMNFHHPLEANTMV